MFCPQYYNGSCPAGEWFGRYSSVDGGWISSQNYAQDFGDFAVAPDPYGITIGAAIGASGYLYNGPQFSAQEVAYGYPGNLSNGQIMYVCNGNGIPDQGSPPNPGLEGMPCDMGEGSSGGPWFTHDPTYGVVVNGHNDISSSAIINGQSVAILYSPYYNSEWYNVFNNAQNR
jgi:hypothetical protein